MEIKLRKKSYEVLRYLVESKGELIERKELIKAVWPDSFDNDGADDNLEQCLKQIWRELPDPEHRILRTIHGQGCRIDVPVTEGVLTESPAAEAVSTKAEPSDRASLQVRTDTADEASMPSADLTRESQIAEDDTQIATLRVREPDKGPISVEDLTREKQRAASEGLNPQGKIPQSRSVEETNKQSAPTNKSAEDLSARTTDEPETFEEWIGGPGSHISFILGCCVVGSAVITAVVFQKLKDPKMAEQAAAAVQCLVILYGFLHAWRWSRLKSFRANEECSKPMIIAAGFADEYEFRTERVNLEKDQEKYARYWKRLLLSWFALYIVFALGDFNISQNSRR